MRILSIWLNKNVVGCLIALFAVFFIIFGLKMIMQLETNQNKCNFSRFDKRNSPFSVHQPHSLKNNMTN